MPLVTRSRASLANDENAVPQQHFRYTKRASDKSDNAVSKPTAFGASKDGTKKYNTRTALVDISNRLHKTKDDQMPKKKRVVEATQEKTVGNEKVSKEAVCKAQELNELVEDVDMKGDSDTSLLEDSVADLKLSSVDAADVDDPQAVTEYINDIMQHLRKTEGKRSASPTYMSRQTDINAKMREILIDWLVEVHIKFKLQPETLYLTVNIIDRFLERRMVSRTKLQLVGCTAMLIAAKYEEIYAPEIQDFVHISDKAYNRDQILTMESIILNTLGFHMTVPTALRFGERLMKVAGCDSQGQNLIKYYIELTLQDYKFLKYLPSMIAASATYLAMKTLTGEGWNATLKEHSQYSEEAIRLCVTDLHQLVIKNPPKYKAVRKKYLRRTYQEVSGITPANPFGN